MIIIFVVGMAKAETAECFHLKMIFVEHIVIADSKFIMTIVEFAPVCEVK